MDQIEPGASSAFEEHPLRAQEASPQRRVRITNLRNHDLKHQCF